MPPTQGRAARLARRSCTLRSVQRSFSHTPLQCLITLAMASAMAFPGYKHIEGDHGGTAKCGPVADHAQRWLQFWRWDLGDQVAWQDVFQAY